MLAKEVKNGAIVVFDSAPCLIETINVQSPSARGAATIYKYKARNVITKQKVDITLRSGESIDEADFSRRPIKLMYTDTTHAHFLDQEDYNQYSLTLEEVEGDLQWITEELDGIMALIYNDKCVGIQIPLSVELQITQCDPGVKGNSATSRTKPATLQTGAVIHVPEYIAEGTVVKIDTRTGQFVSRA